MEFPIGEGGAQCAAQVPTPRGSTCAHPGMSSKGTLHPGGDSDDIRMRPIADSSRVGPSTTSLTTSAERNVGDLGSDAIEGDKITVFESKKLKCVNQDCTKISSLTQRAVSDTESSSDDNDDDELGTPLIGSQSNLNKQTQSLSWADRKSVFSKGLVSAPTAERLYIAWVVIFFAGSSLGAIFINKTCLTGYHFRYPLTLMLGQMTFALLMLTALHAANYMTIPTIGRSDMTVMAIPTALFTSNVVVGLSALSLVNIPMFSAFRRLTLLFVMGAEYLFLQKKHSMAIVNAVVVMTFGAFISAIDDVSFSRLGYCLVFLNNMLTALYLASIKKVMRETQFQPLSLLYYTALMGFPVVAALMLLTGEIGNVVTAFRTQPELTTPAFLLSLTLTASGAFAVNFSTSLCTHVTSPLTTSVAGQVKNVLQTILGFFSWGFVPTRMNVIGLLVALGAQIIFAYLKYGESEADRAAKSTSKVGICKSPSGDVSVSEIENHAGPSGQPSSPQRE